MNPNTINKIKPIKIKQFKFLEIEKATPQFQRIINRYRHKRKARSIKTRTVMAFIDKAKFKVEKLESDKEYILKELKVNIKLEKELFNLYGKRAKNHYNEVKYKHYKSKINKYDFFTPKELKSLKEIKKPKTKSRNKPRALPELSNIIFTQNKTGFSPSSLRKNNNKFANTFNNEITSNTISSKNTKFQNFYNTSNQMKQYNHYKPYRTFDIVDNNINNNLKIKNKSNRNKLIKKNNDYFKTNMEFNDNNISSSEKIKILNLTSYNNNVENKVNVIGVDYINTLDDIKRQFTKSKLKFKDFFRNNDYGCKLSNIEYKYLTKKFYN